MPNRVTFEAAVTGSSFYPTGPMECAKPCSLNGFSISVGAGSLAIIGIIIFVSALEDVPVLTRPKEHIFRLAMVGIVVGMTVIATIMFVAYNIWQNHKAQSQNNLNAVEMSLPRSHD